MSCPVRHVRVWQTFAIASLGVRVRRRHVASTSSSGDWDPRSVAAMRRRPPRTPYGLLDRPGDARDPRRDGGAGSTALSVVGRRGAHGQPTRALALSPAPAPHHVVALRLAGGASTGDPDGRPHVSPRRRIVAGERHRARLRPRRRQPAARLSPADTFAGSHVALAERRVPLADRASAARPRHVAALPAHGSRRGVRRRRSRVDAHVQRARGSRHPRAPNSRPMSSPATSFPFTATLGAAWGHDGSGTRPEGHGYFASDARSAVPESGTVGCRLAIARRAGQAPAAPP